jgi:hypothetical protein
MMRAALAACVAAVCIGAPLHAQSLYDECETRAPAEYRELCRGIADAAASIPPRVALLAAGGNPVPGTASTLGMRVPGSPRFSAALRLTAGRAHIPPIRPGDAEDNAFTAAALALDAGLGVFQGLNVAPTVGGVGSLDVLASTGLLHVPERYGFAGSSSFTWAGGVRVGILRESFTAPGASVSVMYRGLPTVEYEGAAADSVDGAFRTNVINVRAVVGKRILGVGLSGGMGWDRTRTTAEATFEVPELPLPLRVARSMSSDRLSYFGNATYTATILNLVAELGWQQDGERPDAAHPDSRRGGLFGGVAVRIAL